MKIVFWGGPLDGEVREICRLGPIVIPLPQEFSLADFLGTSTSMPSMETMTYWPRELYATNIAKPLSQDTWWVMAPADASDYELQRQIDRHSTPVVDGGRTP